MVSIFNFNFLLGHMDGWIDGWMNTYIYSNSSIFMHRCIYTYTHICTYTNISIYKRIYRHRTCEYINPSIHIWTSGTLNQSPANA